MLKKLSISTKLMVLFIGFSTFILVGILSVIYFLYSASILSDVEKIVILEYENIKNSIVSTPNYTKEGLELEELTVENIDKATNLGLLVFIYDQKGQILESTSSVDQYISKQEVGYFTQKIHNSEYLFYAGNHKGLKIVVGTSMNFFHKNIISLLKVIAISFFFSLCLLAIVGFLFSKKALVSLKYLIDDIHKIDVNTDDLSQIKTGYPNDEVGIIAENLDIFINKLKQKIKIEKELYDDINHELRTPLMVIDTSIELLFSSNTLTPYQIGKLELISQNSQKLKGLINELLFLNKNILSESEKEQIKMSDFFEEILPDFRLLAERKGLVIDFIKKGDFFVFSSKIILIKLLGNIIKNAIFYTNEGKISIILQDNGVSIIDTGIGIAKNDIGNIWKRFYKVDKSRNSQYGGFGLGLSIVKKIADEHQWKIQVESEVGKGTKFTLIFSQKTTQS